MPDPACHAVLTVKGECEDALATCGGLRSLTAARAVIGTSVGNPADASGGSAMFPINQIAKVIANAC